MKQLKSFVAVFLLSWMASFIFCEAHSCKVSSNEAQEWKEYIVSNQKLRNALTEVAKRDLSKICEDPRLNNSELTFTFNVDNMDFYIDSRSEMNKPSTLKPTGPTPVNLESYPVSLALKTLIGEIDRSDRGLRDYDQVIYNDMEAFHQSHGTFTAPISGLYYIRFSHVKWKKMGFLSVNLRTPRVDEHFVSGYFNTENDYEAWGSVSCQMVIPLIKGAKIMVMYTVHDNLPTGDDVKLLLDKTGMFTAFLLPQTKYWTGVDIPYYPAFTAAISRFNEGIDEKKEIGVFYEVAYESMAHSINLQEGVFTTKIRGIYYFSFSTCKAHQTVNPGSNEKNFIEVLKNKQEIVASSFTDGWNGGGKTALPIFVQVALLLEVGDTINVVLRFGGLLILEYFSGQITSLTGFLIVPVPKEQNLMATSYPVFHAHRSALVGMNKTKVTFDLVTLNQGGHLNGQSGVFVAPVKGYYFFSYRDTTLKTSRHTVVKILKNEEVFAAAHMACEVQYLPWMVATINTQAVVLLSAGDQVYIEQSGTGTGDASTTGGRSNLTVAFTGFLLNAMK